MEVLDNSVRFGGPNGIRTRVYALRVEFKGFSQGIDVWPVSPLFPKNQLLRCILWIASIISLAGI